jgi:hypothetical protein
VPISALEHPYVRLLQVVVLVIAIVLGLNQLGLLDQGELQLRTTRISGSDPVAAAASVARASHGRGADTIIVASTEALADGVVATGLAGALDAPILLTAPDALSPQTRDIARELGAERAILIGGTVALSDAVADALSVDLEIAVTRIAGASRFDTAGQAADLFALDADPSLVDGLRTALIVPAEDVPAALEAGSLAATVGAPLPVLISQAGVLPGPSADAVDRLDIEQVIVVGALQGFTGEVRSITGPNGAADQAVELRDFRPPRVVVVPRGDEARTLIAGPLAGRESGVILTIDQAASWMREACGTVAELFVVAEAGVITDLQIAELQNVASNCG